MRPAFSRFVRKSLFLLLPLALSVVLAELAVDDSLFYNTSNVYRKVADYMRDADKARILIFGSSHGNNAIIQSNAQGLFNLALPGQDFKHDLFLLRFIGNLKGGETVIFTVSYFSFEYSEEKEWPFRVLDYQDIQSLRPENRLKNFKQWLFDRSKLLNYSLSPFQILKYYLGKISLLKKAKPSSTGRGEIIQFQAPILTEMECRARLKKDAEKRAVPLQARYHNASKREIEELFAEMAALCRRHGQRILLVATPYSREYNLGVEKKWKDDFDRTLGIYKKKFRVTVFDYSRDPRFEGDCTLFLNADHLNKKGAELFTQVLLADIRGLGRGVE